MITSFTNVLKEKFPEILREPVLVACSGGLDSVALSHLCQEAGLEYGLAHVDFGLRGKESEGDAIFVQEFARKLNKDIFVKSFNTSIYADSFKLSIQETARKLRYDWFQEVLATTRYQWILTAHQANDQLETFLMHLNRGAGLSGLCGIPERQGTVLRPLLQFSRAELADYVSVNMLDYREDSSNETYSYLRNRLRQHVVSPLLDTLPDFLLSFLKSLDYLRGSREILAEHCKEVSSTLAAQEDAVISFDLEKLAALKPREAYLHELFAPYGFTDFRAIADLISAMSGKEVKSATHRLLKDRKALLLKPLTRQTAAEYRFALGEENHYPPGLTITQFDVKEAAGRRDDPKGNDVLHVDKASLHQGLWLRKWRQGDYFCPKGMRGGKKVSKYFKDMKLSQFQKEAQWILGSGDRIVWLPGLRGDDRFKVTEATREIIRFEWQQD